MRSGVNCTLLNSRSSAAASVLTISVLATPGTPSSSTWPRASRAATMPDSAPSWPTTTLPTSSRTARIAVRGSRADGPGDAGAGGAAAGSDMDQDLLADGVDGLGQGDELVVVGHGAGTERPRDAVPVGAHPLGRHGGEHGGGSLGRHAEPVPEEPAQVGAEQVGGVLRRARAVEQRPDGGHQLGPGHSNVTRVPAAGATSAATTGAFSPSAKAVLTNMPEPPTATTSPSPVAVATR